jgi:hypothetical protein
MIRYPGYAPCAPSFYHIFSHYSLSSTAACCCVTSVRILALIIGGLAPHTYGTGL